jgi:ABC-type multidrug transport system ATPase subunit
VNGRLVALLQLGAGFSNEFTGRENIMLNGLILGIERKEMLKRLDEIEAFADIGEFIDQPLKTYSSGMRARLGFAVAVNVEPDILLVDESLSTGDAVFKAKGIQKMRELRDSGVTILFVSHSTNQVRNFCNEAALIHKGRLVSRGDTGEVIDRYQELVSRAAEKRKNRLSLEEPPNYGLVTPEESPTLDDKSSRHGTGEARIENVELLDEGGKPLEMLTPESDLTVRVHVRYTKAVEDSAVGIIFRNEDELDIFSTSTALEKTPIGSRHAGERLAVDFTCRVPLRNGRYSVATAVLQPGVRNSYLDRIDGAATFEVSRPSGRGAFEGLVHLPTKVKVLDLDRVRE